MPTDTERLDWMEKTKHQILYDPDSPVEGDPHDGHWWCVDRINESYDPVLETTDVGWVVRPMSKNIRRAIDLAISESEKEK